MDSRDAIALKKTILIINLWIVSKSTLPLVVFAAPPVVKRCGGHLYFGLALWIQFGAYVRLIQGTVGQTTERLCWDPPMN